MARRFCRATGSGMSPQNQPTFERGAVVLVDLEPVIGSEQGRQRPCIVLSELSEIRAAGIGNPLYFVVPLTTNHRLTGPLAPRLLARAGSLPADSVALVMHARAIDHQRIVRQWGMVDAQDIGVLQQAIAQMVGFVRTGTGQL